MLGRRRRLAILPPLSLLTLAAACYRAPGRAVVASPVQSMNSRLVTTGGELPSPVPSRSTLTLLTPSGPTVVDAANDSVTTRAIRTLIGRSVSELKVDVVGGVSFLRLTPTSQLGEYDRLFVVDGVPLANGFRFAIRTSSLERIEVLDDSLSKSPYGPRAAAGVVLISTRGR